MMNQTQIAAAARIARARANDRRWLAAIDRAAAGLQSGELIVTLLVGYALVTSPNGSYRVNGHCGCKAALSGHAECYHRAAVRLVEMMETASAPAVRVPRIVRSVESDHTGARVRVTYCDGWAI